MKPLRKRRYSKSYCGGLKRSMTGPFRPALFFKKGGETSLDQELRTLIEKATVKISKKGGQGVLIGNGLILTAAHCIDYNCDGDMALMGEYFIEEIVAHDQTQLKVAPLAVEPCSDLAVLGALDGQAFFDECDQYHEFCDRTTPVRLNLAGLNAPTSFSFASGEEVDVFYETMRTPFP